MKQPAIIDLHCDLLSFLTHKPNRSADDPTSRTSSNQLKKGHVKLQTLAIFSPSYPKSVETGHFQVEQFLKLPLQYPGSFTLCRLPWDENQSLIQILPAFENASTFSSEEEPLSTSLARLEKYREKLGPIFYISLTWNEENRFGGGNMSQVGLKEDGRHLLEWLDGKKIAADLSHTSDHLAYEMIEFIDKQRLDIPLIASHSNFRTISNYKRNLPEDLAKEIIRRKGLIGLNLFAPFIHETDPMAILRHLEYGLSLGGEDALSFGADFFSSDDFPALMKKYQRTDPFYPQFSNASAYPYLLDLAAKNLRLSAAQCSKLANGNALAFLQRYKQLENLALDSQIFKCPRI